MNLLSKMLTALRGGVNEAGEAIVDTQALRILDQEIRDASEELKHSKASLAEILAQQKVGEEKCLGLKKEVEEYEGYAIKALEKNDEALAREIAQKIANTQNQLTGEEATVGGYKQSADQLKAAIVQAEQNLKRIKQQVDTVKATENVQRAQAAVAERHSGSESKMQTAMESLERIKEKQALKSAQMNVAKEMAGSSEEASLQDKLQKAGIIANETTADDILARLKK